VQAAGLRRCVVPPFRVRTHRLAVRSRAAMVPLCYLNLRIRWLPASASELRAVRSEARTADCANGERSDP